MLSQGNEHTPRVSVATVLEQVFHCDRYFSTNSGDLSTFWRRCGNLLPRGSCTSTGMCNVAGIRTPLCSCPVARGRRRCRQDGRQARNMGGSLHTCGEVRTRSCQTEPNGNHLVPPATAPALLSNT